MAAHEFPASVMFRALKMPHYADDVQCRAMGGYRAIGYARGEAPLGYAEPADELVVEHDEEVLRSLKELEDFA